MDSTPPTPRTRYTPTLWGGVTLTNRSDDWDPAEWVVVTVDDVVGYPTHRDAVIGYNLTVREHLAR